MFPPSDQRNDEDNHGSARFFFGWPVVQWPENRSNFPLGSVSATCRGILRMIYDVSIVDHGRHRSEHAEEEEGEQEYSYMLRERKYINSSTSSCCSGVVRGWYELSLPPVSQHKPPNDY